MISKMLDLVISLEEWFKYGSINKKLES
jgi:hypothetical protein